MGRLEVIDEFLLVDFHLIYLDCHSDESDACNCASDCQHACAGNKCWVVFRVEIICIQAEWDY